MGPWEHSLSGAMGLKIFRAEGVGRRYLLLVGALQTDLSGRNKIKFQLYQLLWLIFSPIAPRVSCKRYQLAVLI